MYRTDYLEKTNESSLLDFINEREEAIKSIKKRSRIMRVTYISALGVCAIAMVYIGFFANMF